MLAKKYRLPIQSVLSVRGTLMRGRYLSLKVMPGKLSYSRFGVVVGTAVDKRASARNALKRALYNALRQRILTQPSLDVVITLSVAARTAAVRGILEELNQFLDKCSTFY